VNANKGLSKAYGLVLLKKKKNIKKQKKIIDTKFLTVEKPLYKIKAH
jgi:hypothetical protein